MANKNIMLKIIKTSTLILINLVLITNLFYPLSLQAKEKYLNKNILITDLNHINLTENCFNDKKKLITLIKSKRPKALYITERLVTESKKHIKKLRKTYRVAKNHNVKLFLVVGRNNWPGERGKHNTLDALNKYGDYIDGIVLRIEPNRSNIWKRDDENVKAQILNLMISAYTAIYDETKKRDKKFIVEFPFWLSEFKGPKATFSQDACKYCDRIIFIIDNVEKINDVAIKWNDITCPYNISLIKSAHNQGESGVQEIYYKLKNKLSFYSNFQGFIIDSDSTLQELR